MKRTIAITGASGFTGGTIARHFLQKGWRVLAFGRRENVDLEGDVLYQRWDIAEQTITITEPVDVLVHSAAKVDGWGSFDAFYRVNVQGTKNVLETFHGAGQFIYISTSSVYDPFANTMNLRENAPYGERYLNGYGKSKMLAEKELLNSGRTNTVILRPRAIYGVGDTTLLPRILNAKKGRYLLGIGDGNNLMSITNVLNLVDAVEAVTERNFEQVIYNITDAEPLTLRDLYTALAHYMAWDIEMVFVPQNIAISIATMSEWLYKRLGKTTSPNLTPYRVHQLSSNYTLNIEAAYRDLDYQAKYDHHQGFTAVRKWLHDKDIG